MISVCAYCGTGFSETEKRCSYCNAPIPETSELRLIHSGSPMPQNQRANDASLGLNESPKKNKKITCRRKKRSFFAMLFDTSLLEYVMS